MQDDQDDRALCASFYTNGWLKYYRDHGWVPNTTSFYYGMIADTGGSFPRGQALYDTVVPQQEALVAQLLAPLAPDEQRELLRLLRKLDHSLP